MEKLNNVLRCDVSCPQKHVFVLLVLPVIVMLLGQVAGAVRHTGLRNVVVELVLVIVVALLVVYVIEWLCKNGHVNIAWVVAVLPLLASASEGYKKHSGSSFALSSSSVKELAKRTVLGRPY